MYGSLEVVGKSDDSTLAYGTYVCTYVASSGAQLTLKTGKTREGLEEPGIERLIFGS